jgi:hypothetical protein
MDLARHLFVRNTGVPQMSSWGLVHVPGGRGAERLYAGFLADIT